MSNRAGILCGLVACTVKVGYIVRIESMHGYIDTPAVDTEAGAELGGLRAGALMSSGAMARPAMLMIGAARNSPTHHPAI